jgi:hypothetical protein
MPCTCKKERACIGIACCSIPLICICEENIFSNSSHLEWRAELADIILKWYYSRTILAKIGLIWFSGFREEDLNVIFYQNMPKFA